jgi:hypothetical protein
VDSLEAPEVAGILVQRQVVHLHGAPLVPQLVVEHLGHGAQILGFGRAIIQLHQMLEDLHGFLPSFGGRVDIHQLQQHDRIVWLDGQRFQAGLERRLGVVDGLELQTHDPAENLKTLFGADLSRQQHSLLLHVQDSGEVALRLGLLMGLHQPFTAGMVVG